ncbi:MAG: putative transposase [Prosthecobacter sp.]|uniref:putative transposase n=1 Tax=Prosthecobacter sp. TaxID=1965333 RepID=UPI0038FEB206
MGLDRIPAQRQERPKHIELKELPEAERVAKLRSGRKQFIDTIKLIAYRSESALVSIAREKMKRHDDARSLVRGLMRTTVNLRTDIERGELRIELHGQSNPVHDSIVEHLCAELYATETHYPGTNPRLHYAPLRSSPIHGDQDVCCAKLNLEHENEYVEHRNRNTPKLLLEPCG